MPDEHILFERRGRVALVTLNKPDARNPLDEEMVDALLKALHGVNLDPEISCMILTGSGPAFCAGGNIKDMRDRSGLFSGSPAQMRSSYMHGIQRLPLAMYELEVPCIAAVNGPAIGAGCDLAMMCDIRVISERASFAESFLRVGLISGDGGAWYLPRVVGLSRAYQMAFTGDPVTAEQAHSWGIVSDLVPAEGLTDAVLDLANRIAQQPPQALRMMKRLIREGIGSTLAQNLELASAMQPIVQHSRDHLEAVRALREKRSPDFTGE